MERFILIMILIIFNVFLPIWLLILGGKKELKYFVERIGDFEADMDYLNYLWHKSRIRLRGVSIRRFIYMSKFYLRFFFLFLLPILPALIFLELICLGAKLIPDKFADAVFDIMKIDYKD